MKSSDIQIQLGDVIKIGNDNEFNLVIEKMDEDTYRYVEIKRIDNHLVISGVSYGFVNKNLYQYNNDCHNNFIVGITKIYRWKSMPWDLYSCGVIGNAYTILNFPDVMEQFCIYDSKNEH